MEDAHTTLLQLSEDMGDPSDPSYGTRAKKGEKRISFFAVFDGHGGDEVARYAGQHLHTIVLKQPSFGKGDYAAALKEGFLDIDVVLKSDPAVTSHSAGCTSVCGIVSDDNVVYVGNAGDSRCVLSSNGEAIPLSFDHKPTLAEESQRIYAAGGFVSMGRVNGNLALSRALGDFEFKDNARLPPEKQAVTAFPDVIRRQLVPEDEFLILACDGIWDCLSNERAVQVVRELIARGVELGEICEAVMMQCLATDVDMNAVGADNMTIMIVAFLQGRSLQEWSDAIAARVEAAGAAAARGAGSLSRSTISGGPEDAEDSDRSSQQSPMHVGKLISDDEDEHARPLQPNGAPASDSAAVESVDAEDDSGAMQDATEGPDEDDGR